MNRRLVWPFSYSFFHYAAVAAVTPFLVLHYQNLGFNGSQIGLLTGITPLISLVFTPFWTGLADTTRRHHLILGFILLAAASTLVVFPLLTGFLLVLLIAVLFTIFYGSLASFGDSSAMVMLGEKKALYGRVRLGGTIGYGIAAVVVGALVQHFGLRAAFWSCAVFLLVNFAVSRFLQFGETGTHKTDLKSLVSLLTHREWGMFLVLAVTGGISLGILSNFLFPMMRELGASESLMGLALTIGTIAEVPVLFFGNKLLQKFKAGGLLKAALLGTALRYILYFTAQTPAAVLLIQLTNGLTFPAFWIAGVSWADEHAPAGLHTTTQGIFSAAVWGVGNALGGFAGGPLLQAVGARALFLFSGVTFVVILAAASLFRKKGESPPVEIHTGMP